MGRALTGGPWDLPFAATLRLPRQEILGIGKCSGAQVPTVFQSFGSLGGGQGVGFGCRCSWRYKVSALLMLPAAG